MRRFLQSAGQVVETLCVENLLAVSGRSAGFNEANSLEYSQRHAYLSMPDVLGTRENTDLCFDAGGGALLAAFGKAIGPLPPEADPPIDPEDKSPEAKAKRRDATMFKRLASGGLLATWRLYRPDTPWAVMRCVGIPSCCLLPVAKPHLAFAGTEEGSIQIWNLREPGSSHPSVDIGNGDRLAVRAPTYASDSLANVDSLANTSTSAHMCAISEIVALPVASEDGELTIGSLDLEGTLILWVVLEQVEIDASDLGQAVGGKERLLRTATVPLTSLEAAAGGGVLPTRCFSMTFLPSDPSRLLLSTDLPQVLHRSRYTAPPGSPPAPPPTPHTFECISEQLTSCGATNVAFCPTSPNHFVSGRTDGSIALYHIEDGVPLLSWGGFNGGAAITQVAWSGSRPAVFWALDSDGTLHAFNLLDSTGKPFVSSKSHTDGGSPSRRRGGSTGGTGVTGGGGGMNGYANGGSNGGGGGGGVGAAATRPKMRFALDQRADGGKVGSAERLCAVSCRNPSGEPLGIEVHVLTETCATPQADEAKKLAHFLKVL